MKFVELLTVSPPNKIPPKFSQASFIPSYSLLIFSLFICLLIPRVTVNPSGNPPIAAISLWFETIDFQPTLKKS